MLKTSSAAAVVAVALLLSGCAASGAAATASSAPTAAETTPAAAGGADPGSIAADRLLAALGNIDAGLNSKYSVYDAQNVCTYVKSGSSDSELRTAVKARFSDRAEGTLTKAKLTRIVKVLRDEYCPVRLGT